MAEDNLIVLPCSGGKEEASVYSAERSIGETGAVYRNDYKQLLARIIDAYGSSTLIRTYCKIRFAIININILHILALCLRGKRRVLELGCGFGMFGCYFAALYPEIEYRGIDLNPNRIKAARDAAARLGLTNMRFDCVDVRELSLDDQHDAIMIIDLLHHIDDHAKCELLATCSSHLSDNGRLIIKDINTRPFWKLAFTWALDVGMTRGFDMWYWDEERFYAALRGYFNRIDNYPIADLLPYPHIVYLCENVNPPEQ
jgi:2-polyprenyl-3-methyl-5-hydroxy-6-metoxy-1,4-benzoquinol methylase